MDHPDGADLPQMTDEYRIVTVYLQAGTAGAG